MAWDDILDRISAALSGGAQGFVMGQRLHGDEEDRRIREEDHKARLEEAKLNRERLQTADRERGEDRELELIRRGYRRGSAPTTNSTGALPDTSMIPGPATGLGGVSDGRYHQVRPDLYLDTESTPEFLSHRDRMAAEQGRNQRADESLALRDLLSQRDWQHRTELQGQRMEEAYRRMADAISMNMANRQNDPARGTDQVLRAAQMLMSQDEDLDFNTAVQRATEELGRLQMSGAPTPRSPVPSFPQRDLAPPGGPSGWPVSGPEGPVHDGTPSVPRGNVDRDKLNSDPAYRAWVLKKMGLTGRSH